MNKKKNMLFLAPKAIIVLLVSFTLFTFSFAAASHLSFSKPGVGARDGITLLPKRRLLSEDIAPSTVSVSPEDKNFVLAAARTHRRDPLNNYHPYTGGWNISNSHYWASVAFTAVPLFVIAIVWFLGFGVYLLVTAYCYCFCRQRESPEYSEMAYTVSLGLLIFFTFAAVIGCIVLYTGEGKFLTSTTATLNYVVEQANFTVDNLRNFSDTLAAAQRVKVNTLLMPEDVQTRIDTIQTKLNMSASELSARTTSNSKKIDDVLDAVGIDLIVVAAVMLLLVFLGFVFSVLGLRLVVYILVLISWFLVAITFILCGIFLLFHNVIADTCVAMHEWVLVPHVHTALDDILPCLDVATANQSLSQSREVTYQMANIVNDVISQVCNSKFSPDMAPLYFNQSGPKVPSLCNPYYTNNTKRECQAGEVGFNNATKVWKTYLCEVTPVGVCSTVGRITPEIFGQMSVATNISFGVYHYTPFFVELQDCTFARDTFASIARNDCPGLRLYTKWIVIGLLMVSAAVLLSLVFWVMHTRERLNRRNSNQFTSDHCQGKASY